MDSSKGPNRVNRAHCPTKENSEHIYIFCFFHRKNGLGWPQIGPGGFLFPDILGRMDLDFDSFHFYFPQPKLLEFQVPRSPISQNSRFPDFQTPAAPPAPATADELSDPNLTPLPTHPGIKYGDGENGENGENRA